MAPLLKLVPSSLKHERKLVGIFFIQLCLHSYISSLIVQRKVVNKVYFFLIEGKCLIKLFMLHL